MTRAAVTITTYSQRVTCDRCGLALYVRRADVDRWLRGLGWEVGERDVCPGCKESKTTGENNGKANRI